MVPKNARARLTTQGKKQRAGKGFPSDTGNPPCRVTRSPSDRSSRLTESPQAPVSFCLPAAPFGEPPARCPWFCRLSRPIPAAGSKRVCAFKSNPEFSKGKNLAFCSHSCPSRITGECSRYPTNAVRMTRSTNLLISVFQSTELQILDTDSRGGGQERRGWR